MSLDLSEGPAETPSRKKAAWALGVIALVAVVISVVMIFAFGSSPGPSHPVGVPLPTGTAPPLDPATTPTPTPSSAVDSPTSTPAVLVTPGPASCPTSAPCVVSGDPGNAAAAVLAYRVSHGVPAVPVSTSAAAQTCALHEGDEASCPQGYYWEPVSALDGAALVAKIATHPAGAAMLADPKAKSFSVGWAYVPSGSGGQIQAVVVENG